MPVSNAIAKSLAEALIMKKNYTATTAYIGMSTSGAGKTVTAKELGEKEPTEANGWKRIQIDTAEWEEVAGAGESTPSKFRNKNEIKWEPPLTAGEYKLEFAEVMVKAKISEDEATTAGVLLFGKLVTPVTINSATTVLKFAPKELTIEIT